MNAHPLSEAELDRLEELLEDDVFEGESMRLDEIQALLCAVISSPEPVMPAVWLREALGPGIDKAQDAVVGECIELVTRFNNDLAASLLANDTVQLLVYPEDESCETYDYAAWADAYVYGAGLGSDWYEIAGKHADDLSELLEPLMLLNGMLKEDVEKNGERWFAPAEEARLLAEVQENLPVIVQSLYNFWRNKRGGTVQRSSEKIGRNDECSCGSGKKYKQCCGRPDRLN